MHLCFSLKPVRRFQLPSYESQFMRSSNAMIPRTTVDRTVAPGETSGREVRNKCNAFRGWSRRRESNTRPTVFLTARQWVHSSARPLPLTPDFQCGECFRIFRCSHSGPLVRATRGPHNYLLIAGPKLTMQSRAKL